MAELAFLHSARHLTLIDICINFGEYSLSSFQVIERTRFFVMHKVQRETTQKYKRQSYHSCSARHLMLINFV